MIWCYVAAIARTGSVPSPLAREGCSESQQQDWVRGAARPLIQTYEFERRRCLLPQEGEKAAVPTTVVQAVTTIAVPPNPFLPTEPDPLPE